MMNQETLLFIRRHAGDDIRQLAFLGDKNPEVDMPFALDQIRGRQMARTKLPSWAAVEGIVYPPHLSMEQCSSEFTARYKARLAADLLSVSPGCSLGTAPSSASLQTPAFVDLTGGFGVDFSFIASALQLSALYVERQKHLCDAATENFRLLNLPFAKVVNADGTEVLHQLGHARLVFLDPARRDDAGHKVVSLQDCTPDVTLLVDELMPKAECVMVKLSPMLDWHKAVAELSPWVREVHIVSAQNECKELLLVLKQADSSGNDAQVKVFCVNDGQSFSFVGNASADAQDAECTPSADAVHSDASPTALRNSTQCTPSSASLQETAESASLWLFEPNASLMKAGCFGELASQFRLQKIAPNSHLFLADHPVPDFPGRCFRVRAVSSMNKKELKRHLSGRTQANVATRNFPLSVAELRKRLKLKEGGETYIFATTLADTSHVLFFCEKAV